MSAPFSRAAVVKKPQFYSGEEADIVMQSSADQRFHMSECEKWDPGVSCRTLGARDCGLLLLVIAATLAYRRQQLFWDAMAQS